VSVREAGGDDGSPPAPPVDLLGEMLAEAAGIH
jgi:hypothetical protein